LLTGKPVSKPTSNVSRVARRNRLGDAAADFLVVDEHRQTEVDIDMSAYAIIAAWREVQAVS
jgi:hypothetical protein